MTLRDKLFSFRGRLRRRDWWLLSALIWVACFLITDLSRWALFGPDYAMLAPGRVDWSTAAHDWRIRATNVAWVAISLWPGLALAIKRTHDRGKGARAIIWLILTTQVFNLIDYLFHPVAFVPRGELVLSIISTGLGAWVLIILGLPAGERGANQYGPSPKGDGGPGGVATAQMFD